MPSSWPVALGYAPWVEEIWVNHLSNALKHSGEPPRIVLGAASQPDGRVRFWVQDMHRLLVFCTAASRFLLFMI